MKLVFILAICMIQLSCYQSSLSEKGVQKIVQSHYDKDPFFDKPEIEIKLIKDVNPDHKVVIVNIEKEKYAYGFIDKTLQRYRSFMEFDRAQGKITHASNWGVQLIRTVDGSAQDKKEYSVFLGIVPYEGYSEIEMSWNCQKPEVTKLVDGQYFMFVYPKLNVRRCNTVYLINDKKEKTKIDYKDGKFSLD